MILTLVNTKEGDTTNVPISADDDPRLAHTGVEVAGREVIDDHVLLAFFEHILERGEAYERAAAVGEEAEEDDSFDEAFDAVDSLGTFVDRHGRQLLWLAKEGAGLD